MNELDERDLATLINLVDQVQVPVRSDQARYIVGLIGKLETMRANLRNPQTPMMRTEEKP